METFVIETFLPLVGNEFLIRGSENTSLPIVLVRADSLANGQANYPAWVRRPFSLLFRGPLNPELSQGLYPLEHRALEPNWYFLVPVERKEDGMYYEAVFN